MLLFGSYDNAFSLLLGSVWGCANFFCIRKLIISCFTHEWDLLSIAIAVLFKFPLLYLAGFIILNEGFPPLPFLIGMSLIFAAIFLKVTSKALARA